MANRLQKHAMVAASQQRTHLCKEFLRKHYCSHISNVLFVILYLIIITHFLFIGSHNHEELYTKILSITKNDTVRVYNLMKHARHSCFDLVGITNNDQQLIDLFQFLNNLLP
jgi:hypothetical protein